MLTASSNQSMARGPAPPAASLLVTEITVFGRKPQSWIH
jgi:hypothetical protein